MAYEKRKICTGILYGGIIFLLSMVTGVYYLNISINESRQHTDIVSKKIKENKPFQSGWMEVFLGGKKIGYLADIDIPVESGHKIFEEIYLKLRIQDYKNTLHIATSSFVDQNFFLRDFKFSVYSDAVDFLLSGKVKGSQIILEEGEGTKSYRRCITLSSPPMIASGMRMYFKGKIVKVGEIFNFSIFDPSSMTQDNIIVRASANEEVVIDNLKISSLRLETEFRGYKLKFWLDKNGNVLKETGLMGLTLVRCDESKARQGIVYSDDFYEIAAIPTNKMLPDQQRMNYLKLKFSGLKDIVNDGRQNLRDGIIEISRERFPLTATYLLPYNDTEGSFEVYMKPESGIESNNSEIIEKAGEIRKDDRDPLSVAKKFMEWIHKNVKNIPVITLPGAATVLRTRVGDCSEHAVLFTAFLRSSGIPARLCTGLVYSEGKFYYHAWTEGYFGRWVSMDSTLNQMPADVTHIKLNQGGADIHLKLVEFIGKLRVEALEYSYD